MKPAICIIGPTATGKTDLAVALHSRLDAEIISVDSAMVYRGMDIGTAKPGPDVLARAPHHLIDIRDPSEHYSAGDFRRDALELLDRISAAGRVPILVGGTMLYFRALEHGLADLPAADPALRERLNRRAARKGWHALHAELEHVDPAAAARIHPNDPQRIQRALEVHHQSGQPLTALQERRPTEAARYRFVHIALVPHDRSLLHAIIEKRFNRMISMGFIDEVRSLFERTDLNRDTPAMRAVGYRQLWDHLEGKVSRDEAIRQGIVATRRLAKRQMTWIRGMRGIHTFETQRDSPHIRVLELIKRELVCTQGPQTLC